MLTIEALGQSMIGVCKAVKHGELSEEEMTKTKFKEQLKKNPKKE